MNAVPITPIFCTFGCMAADYHTTLRLAILDLYEGVPNEGMRCIREIIECYGAQHGISITCDEFEVRNSMHLPETDYDIFISSGGPGSPLDSRGSEWEKLYFRWLRQVEDYNNDPRNKRKKSVLFICHSFQLACRYFQVGHVAKRKSTAFGVFPIHIMAGGREEPAFSGLHDPFFAVDSRDYQVIEPDQDKMERIGAVVLAIEKERPHVPLERAVMAIRFNEYMLGTQFHPEADPTGMTVYLQSKDKKHRVIEHHGLGKWKSMVEQLNDPEKIRWTHAHVIPNFLDQAVANL